MSTKTLEDARFKAVEVVVGEHEIEFYALAFSKTPDKQGDRIHPRALDAWLRKFYAAGKPLPISFHHSAILGQGAGDPFSVIGYAPADPEHVSVDDYGLKVRAILETEINDKAEQVYRLAKRGVLTGASAVFASNVKAEKRLDDGSVLIMDIPEVREAGPTLTPANDDAHVLSVKAEERELEKWDGAAAMRSCDTAAEFRQIAFELQNDSDPATAAHWALPHHPRPGADADQGGVSAALGRLNQTGATVMSKDAIRSHLEAHQPSERAASIMVEIPIDDELRAKAGRTISAANARRLRDARQLIDELLALVATEPAEEEKQEAKAGPNDWVRKALAEFEEKDTATASA
jgi:HK97 family phage prohead protease